MADILQVDKSTISRSIHYLLDNKYIKKGEAIKSSTTSRSPRSFDLTNKGSTFLRFQDEFDLKQTQSLCENISKKESQLLAKYLLCFANIKREDAKKNAVDQIIEALTKLSFDHGITGNNFLGSGHSTLDWIFLSEVKYNNLQLTQIAQLVNLPVALLSHNLANYQKNKIIQVKSSVEDKRAKILSLAVSGEVALKKIESKAIEVFATALESLSDNDLECFAETFSQYLNSNIKRREIWLSDELCISNVNDHSQLMSLRWQLIEMLSNNKFSYPLGEKIFANLNYNFVFQTKKEIVGGVELEQNKGVYRIVNLVFKKSDQAIKNITIKDLQSSLDKLFGFKLKLQESNLKLFQGL